MPEQQITQQDRVDSYIDKVKAANDPDHMGNIDFDGIGRTQGRELQENDIYRDRTFTIGGNEYYSNSFLRLQEIEEINEALNKRQSHGRNYDTVGGEFAVWNPGTPKQMAKALEKSKKQDGYYDPGELDAVLNPDFSHAMVIRKSEEDAMPRNAMDRYTASRKGKLDRDRIQYTDSPAVHKSTFDKNVGNLIRATSNNEQGSLPTGFEAELVKKPGERGGWIRVHHPDAPGAIRIRVSEDTKGNLSSDVRGVQIEIGGKLMDLDVRQWQEVSGYLKPEKTFVEQDDDPTDKTPTPPENEDDGEGDEPVAPGNEEEEIQEDKREKDKESGKEVQDLNYLREKLEESIESLEQTISLIEGLLIGDETKKLILKVLSDRLDGRRTALELINKIEGDPNLEEAIGVAKALGVTEEELKPPINESVDTEKGIQQKSTGEAEAAREDKQEVEEDTTPIPVETERDLERRDLARRLGIRNGDSDRMKEIYADYRKRVIAGEEFKTADDYKRLKGVGEVRGGNAERTTDSIIEVLLKNQSLTNEERSELQSYLQRLKENPNIPLEERRMFRLKVREIRARLGQTSA